MITLTDIKRRVKILKCVSTFLTKIHSARATVGGSYRPRVMKVLPMWHHILDMSLTDYDKCASRYSLRCKQVC